MHHAQSPSQPDQAPASQVAQRPPAKRPILFTAFEPSGDDHAAPVIAEIIEREPGRPVYAWGGPKMEAAGAVVVERTGENAVMGMPGLAKIREHKKINARIRKWMASHKPVLHVPVDSPAANFPIAAMAKAQGTGVVHLVAPQVWAWGSWRVAKLRRLTDLVLCLLPFEEGWFTTRGVPARFIGHPLFDHELDPKRVLERARAMPEFPLGGHGGEATGPWRIGLFPGSRPSELEKNLPLLLGAYRELAACEKCKRDGRAPVAMIVAVNEAVEQRLRELADRHGGVPKGVSFIAGDTDSAVRWSELTLVVSGTVTLQIARQNRPMVVFYKSNELLYNLIGRWIVSTRYFTLPNLIAGTNVVPELVPHFGGPEPIAIAARTLLTDPQAMADQVQALKDIAGRFDGLEASLAATDAILEQAARREG
ncbi:MAG: lipid-A-disaccharide synthase [Phycisphaerales bacterium JB060]